VYVLYRSGVATSRSRAPTVRAGSAAAIIRITALTNVPLRAFDAAATLQALEDGVCVASREWRVLFANAAFARVAGGEPDVLAGHSLWDVLPALAAAAGDELRATMADGRARARRTDALGALGAGGAGGAGGDGCWHDVRATAVPGTGIAIQLRDVSAVVRAERELRERSDENASLRDVANALAEEEDLARLLELICTEAAEQCHADGAAVVELAEGQGVAVASTGLLDFVRGRRHSLAGSLAERAIAGRAPVRADDYPSEFQGRAWADVGGEAGVGPLLLAPLVAHGAILGVLTVGRRRGTASFGDREVQRIRAVADQAALAIWKTRLFEAAQAANRAKSEFMATMSHELRTPLTAIQGYEELMADEILGPLSDEQRQALERMRWSTQLLTTIVEEILTYSRLEAGEVTAHPQPMRAAEVVNEVAAVLAPLASARDLALAIALPAEPVELVSDPGIVRRVLVNLGANAVKFTDRGEVELAVIEEPQAICFLVRDTGVGIAAADLKRLFQPFTQLHGGVTRRHGGTGLGLYTAWRLASLVGGRIDVRSTPGTGSTFTLVLPKR
jgi:signal transduction histidine kinase